MPFDFDRVIDRSGTDSAKWDPAVLKEKFGAEDMLSFWVADMDFEVAPEILEAVRARAVHGIYGYTAPIDLNGPFCGWVRRRHGWDVEREWVVNTPGVVCALNAAVQAFTMPGDKVLVQRPVYYPFSEAIEHNGRQVVSSSLVHDGDRYVIDFDDFERKAADPLVTMFVLCSPHNPVARVWDEQDLRRLMGICLANDVLVVADEIHNDLVLPGHEHHVLAGLDPAFAQRCVTCMAPSKTFNLAGMQTSAVVIPNPQLRGRFERVLGQLAVGGFPNPFAAVASRAAYEHGDAWLDALLPYLAGNVERVREHASTVLPGVRFTEHEGTYLMWLDFRAYEVPDERLHDVIYHRARVAMDGGSWFGPEGEGFMRLNVACPRALLDEGLDRIAAAFEEEGLAARV